MPATEVDAGLNDRAVMVDGKAVRSPYFWMHVAVDALR